MYQHIQKVLLSLCLTLSLAALSACGGGGGGGDSKPVTPVSSIAPGSEAASSVTLSSVGDNPSSAGISSIAPSSGAASSITPSSAGANPSSASSMSSSSVSSLSVSSPVSSAASSPGVSGTWTIDAIEDGTECGEEETYSYTTTYVVVQTGSALSVMEGEETYQGTLDGSTLNWSGIIQEDGGITNLNVTATINGDAITGSSSWTYVLAGSDGEDDFTCSGTTQFSGTRTQPVAGSASSASSVQTSVAPVLSSAASLSSSVSSEASTSSLAPVATSSASASSIASSVASSITTSAANSSVSVSSPASSAGLVEVGKRSTFTFPITLGTNSGIPTQTLTSFLDISQQVHLAWVGASEDAGQRLHYGKVDASGTLDSTPATHPHFDLIWSVNMAVSEAGSPHMVFQGRRDTSISSSNSGNLGIYYVGPDFSATKVSSNPETETLKTAGLYDAYVNGRPDIFLDAGDNPHIIYDVASNSATSYKRYAALASASSGWQPAQLFNAGELLKKTVSPDHEYQVTHYASTSGPFIRMDISDYHIHAFTDNSYSSLTGYGGYTNVTDVQAVSDGEGNTYAIWLRDKTETDTEEGDYAFYMARLSAEGTFDELLRLPVVTESITGNFAPVTIDPLTGHVYLMYFEGFLGSLSKTHLMVYAPEHGAVQHFVLPTGLGVPYGKGSLWAYDNTLSYVAYSNSTKLVYVTLWENIDLQWDLPDSQATAITPLH
ncbi:hypothetical protein [Cellvibrio japonicus]|nr:hypothetical protein [Cellvibrio japonicus]QEI13610.1 hypothetical protein FY117_16255 [Cellvibrio japonicus]QEI17184.1 hypothetical protein FY116_16260 [Cellvibrio japonicus]QEI20761.1 hypothetical protein FY115_16255 [Cellvibrio japonicus]